jgi:hypothetical protein
MKKISELLSTFFNVKLLLAVILAGLALFILFTSLSQHLPSERSPAQPASSAGGGRLDVNVTRENGISVSDRNEEINKSRLALAPQVRKNGVTYLPGVPRPAKRRAGDLSALSNIDAQWWLLAASEEEVRWLDQLGFPTPAEEKFLLAASDAELSRLAEEGDMNARAHLATRTAKKAFTSGNRAEVERAVFAQDTALAYLAGPYQAIVFAKGFGEMLSEYRALPENEQTDERKAMLKMLNYREQVASLVASAYGDPSVRYFRNIMNYSGLQKEFGWEANSNWSETSNVLAASARLRAANGLPPLTIIPRPIPNQATPPNERVIFERY